MYSFIHFANNLSAWVGKAFAWLIILMTFGISYEVFVRYVLNAPTPWALDVAFIMYGSLLMMGGAYTLSKNAHVRGDFLYRNWAPRTQASVDLVLYFVFFFPASFTLMLSGLKYASRSWRFTEVSVNSPAGIPVYQFKAVLVATGILLVIQGIAQVLRCIDCIRNGEWLETETDDVEETEIALAREAEERLIHQYESDETVTPEGKRKS